MIRFSFAGIIVFVCSYVNYTSEFLDDARFKHEAYERLQDAGVSLARVCDPQRECKYCDAIASETKQIESARDEQRERQMLANVEQQQNKATEPICAGTWNTILLRCAKRMQRLSRFISRHKLDLLYLPMFITNMALLLLYFVRSLAYGFIETTRNKTTGEYVHPLQKWLEQHYIIDYLTHYSQRSGINKMLVLFMGQYLLSRIRYVYHKMQAAELNKHVYTHLNIVQLDFAYLSEVRSTLGEMFYLMGPGWSNEKSADKQGCMDRDKHMRAFSKRIRKLGKFDRVYFFNQIEFNANFAGYKHLCTQRHEQPVESHMRCIEFIEADIVPVRRESLELAPTDGRSEFWRQARQLGRALLSLDDEGAVRRGFVAAPVHRSSSVHQCSAVCAIVYGLSFLVLTLFFANMTFCIRLLTAYGLSLDDLTGTATLAISNVLQSREVLLLVSTATLQFSVIGWNLLDTALVLQAGLVSHSRNIKVSRMLSDSLEEHRDFMRLFRAHTRRNRVDWCSASAATYELICDDFKRNILPKSACDDFNEAIMHMLDLIDVLNCEMLDRKKYFTFNLNICVIAGTASLALTVSLVTAAESLDQQVHILSASAAVIVPLLFALFLGAVCERSVSMSSSIVARSRAPTTNQKHQLQPTHTVQTRLSWFEQVSLQRVSHHRNRQHAQDSQSVQALVAHRKSRVHVVCNVSNHVRHYDLGSRLDRHNQPVAATLFGHDCIHLRTYTHMFNRYLADLAPACRSLRKPPRRCRSAACMFCSATTNRRK